MVGSTTRAEHIQYFISTVFHAQQLQHETKTYNMFIQDGSMQSVSQNDITTCGNADNYLRDVIQR
jgi:hypothetical protein